MLVGRTVKARILNPTSRKKQLLEKEYSNAQKYVSGESENLYSATKQAMDKYAGKDNGEEKPLFLRNDTFQVEKAENTEEFDYWAKIPVHDEWGGIQVPIVPHREIKEERSVKDSKVVKKDDYFELHISVRFEVEPQQDFSGVLAVDLGESTYATAVLSSDGRPRFYGEDIRGIRRHYSYLRRKLQEKGLQEEVKRIGQKESRTVRHRLHEISRELVDFADQQNAVIVLGDVKEVGGDTEKGRRMNRIANTWAVGKLRNFIQYRAQEKGIPVFLVDEAYTSQTCHRCKERKDTNRMTQGRFKCGNCGLDHYNADVNAAKNILDRFSAYIVENGAAVNQPETQASNEPEVSNFDFDDLGSSFLTEALAS
ncbi:MAG: RNA-guided endonuclease InsQ/TnpB family protein [Candidatus Nanohalobium sp.]